MEIFKTFEIIRYITIICVCLFMYLQVRGQDYVNLDTYKTWWLIWTVQSPKCQAYIHHYVYALIIHNMKYIKIRTISNIILRHLILFFFSFLSLLLLSVYFTFIFKEEDHYHAPQPFNKIHSMSFYIRFILVIFPKKNTLNHTKAGVGSW